MRIATKLSLAAFVPALMALVIGLAVVFSFRTMEESRERGETVQRIMNSTNNLMFLAQSNLLRNRVRARLQFSAEQATLKKLIDSARLKNKDQIQLLSRIRESSDAMNRSFLRLASSRGNGASPEDTVLHREAQERLAGHVLVKAHDAWSAALRLESLINDEIATTQGAISTLRFLLILIVTVPLTMLLLRLRRTITASLAALLKGTEVVGAGDLNYRIGKADPDEFGEISRAFDMMTERLQNTTVTRDALGREVEERKRTEEELRQLAQRLNSHIENTPLAVIEWDSDYRVIRWSEEAERVFGWSTGEILGKRIDDVRWVYEEDWPIAAKLMEDMTAGIRPRNVNPNRNYRKDGSVIYCEWYNSALRDSSGNITSVLSLVLDVTERKDIERQREELYQRERWISEMLQQALIPTQIPTTVSGCHFAARYVPGLAEAQVGGDFYDVFEIGDGRVAVLIGDVAGKGVRAAMQVSAARYAFRSYAYIEPRPSRVVSLVNDALCKDHDDEASMLTAFFAIVDTHSRTITYTNGGHEPPVIRRIDGSVEELNVGARALGILPGCNYPEESLRLEPGDVIVLVTDGITEARSEDRGMFGKSEMLRFLANEIAPPAELVDRLLEKASEYGNGHLQDDVVIVALGLERSCVGVNCNG